LFEDIVAKQLSYFRVYLNWYNPTMLR